MAVRLPSKWILRPYYRPLVHAEAFACGVKVKRSYKRVHPPVGQPIFMLIGL